MSVQVIKKAYEISCGGTDYTVFADTYEMALKVLRESGMETEPKHVRIAKMFALIPTFETGEGKRVVDLSSKGDINKWMLL